MTEDDVRELAELRAENQALRDYLDALSVDHAEDARITYLAGQRAGGDPAALQALAVARMLDGPVHDFATRDFLREAEEELADARNYLCWAVRQAPRAPRSLEAVAALGLIIAAFDRLAAARAAGESA